MRADYFANVTARRISALIDLFTDLSPARETLRSVNLSHITPNLYYRLFTQLNGPSSLLIPFFFIQ